MTQTFWPFPKNSAGTQVLEPQWTQMARNWLATGVLSGFRNQLAVTASGNAMQVSIDTGAANIMGAWLKNDTSVAMPIAAADPTNPRIDVIAIRVDWVANTVAFVVLQGVPNANPVAPALTQTDILITPATARWEIGLANVTVPAGATAIQAANVTDKRTFTSGPTSVPTPGATAQYDSNGGLVANRQTLHGLLSMLYGGDSSGIVIARYNNTADYQWRTNDDGTGIPQDNTKPSWAIQMSSTNNDEFSIYRAPAVNGPGKSVYTLLFQITNAGIVVQPAWITPTLLNGWTAFGASWATVGYFKDSMGFVHIKGLIRSGTTTVGTPLFTLPAGYRPSEQNRLPAATSNSGGTTDIYAEVDIYPNGNVQVGGVTPIYNWLSFGEIVFKAEQ